MKLQELTIKDLQFAEYNPRNITKEEFAGLKASLKKYGQVENIIVNKDMTIISGHQRSRAWESLGNKTIMGYVLDLSKHEEKKLNVLMNSQAISGTYDDLKLSELLEEMKLDDDYAELRLDVLEPLDLSEEVPPEEGQEEVPELKGTPFVVKGDIFQITAQGCKYRIGCLDSLSSDDMDKLSDGELAELAHNDPPYGMKKEKEGVVGDNMNYDDLLQFNKDWINLQWQYLKENGSFYCWGIDEPLMDIYSHILKPLVKEQKATFRNLITWNKSHLDNGNVFSPFGASGMTELRSYPVADEKCLFAMLGVQGFNNNADNYFEGWEPIRKYLNDEMEKCGGTKKWKEALGNQMGGHYFTKSQWTLPTEEAYKKLQNYGKNNHAFKKEYDELKKEYYSTRAYFVNADKSNNVWGIEITKGEEKKQAQGHATPKPIALCERAIKSSCPENGLVLDWFCGSGSTAVACIKTKRNCYTCDISEHYTQVATKRCLEFMNKNNIEFDITLNGESFDITKLN